TGVFLKTRVMTCNVDEPWLVMVVWLAAGLLSLAGAFCYAELGAMMPSAGGDFVFLRRAYGRLTSFLYGWTVFAIMKTGSQAALAVGFAIFLNTAMGGALDGVWLTVPLGDGVEVRGGEERHLEPPAPRLRHRPQLAGADLHQREFRGHEEAVGRHKAQYQQDFQRYAQRFHVQQGRRLECMIRTFATMPRRRPPSNDFHSRRPPIPSPSRLAGSPGL
ncbi:MAG: Serine/threonine exchanger SteT, partial [Verrucomicrobiota bacterium]